MTPALISIIVPVYKVEQYLRSCLDSIIRQTYSNLEIILIDDGSPDGCGVICDDYADKDFRIRVIHQQNAGVSAARNVGLDVASGDYIMFVDSDDWLEKNACECLMSVIQCQQSDYVCFGYNEIYPSGKTNRFFIKEPCVVDKNEMMRLMVSGAMFIGDTCWNKIVSRRLLENVRFTEGKQFEDIGIGYKLIHLAERIYITNNVLYNYLRYEGSITSNPYKPNQIEDRFFFINKRLDFLKNNYPELVDIQLTQVIRLLLIAQDRLEGDQEKRKISKELDRIVETYKSRMPSLIKSSKMIWVFYYCPILMKPLMRIRHYKLN